MDRRTILAAASAVLTAPGTLFAQAAARVYRIALLDEAGERALLDMWSAFRDQLRKLGYVEGKNLSFDARYAGGVHERLPALAADLVARKPDVIATAGSPAASAAIKATSSIPIIFVGSGDPVGAGLVASLSRPGANATGISTLTAETNRKSLELLHELSPGAKRLGYLTDASNNVVIASYARIEESARKLKLSVQMLDGRERVALERSFATIRRERLQGLFVSSSGVILGHRDQIVQFAAREKLPVVYGRREFADAGGLLSYGADLQSVYARGAEFVHRILKGAKPADLPVEQISSVRMVLNMKTARAQGIVVPASLRVRADEVIE